MNLAKRVHRMGYINDDYTFNGKFSKSESIDFFASIIDDDQFSVDSITFENGIRFNDGSYSMVIDNPNEFKSIKSELVKNDLKYGKLRFCPTNYSGDEYFFVMISFTGGFIRVSYPESYVLNVSPLFNRFNEVRNKFDF